MLTKILRNQSEIDNLRDSIEDDEIARLQKKRNVAKKLPLNKNCHHRNCDRIKVIKMFNMVIPKFCHEGTS